MTKSQRLCAAVSRIIGGTGMRVRTAVPRSSRASHRTAATSRSLFAMYGRKELLAKSPSPITTARNGGAPGASVPSAAMPSTRGRTSATWAAGAEEPSIVRASAGATGRA